MPQRNFPDVILGDDVDGSIELNSAIISLSGNSIQSVWRMLVCYADHCMSNGSTGWAASRTVDCVGEGIRAVSVMKCNWDH